MRSRAREAVAPTGYGRLPTSRFCSMRPHLSIASSFELPPIPILLQDFTGCFIPICGTLSLFPPVLHEPNIVAQNAWKHLPDGMHWNLPSPSNLRGLRVGAQNLQGGSGGPQGEGGAKTSVENLQGGRAVALTLGKGPSVTVPAAAGRAETKAAAVYVMGKVSGRTVPSSMGPRV
jgi:hypothetical protein